MDLHCSSSTNLFSLQLSRRCDSRRAANKGSGSDWPRSAPLSQSHISVTAECRGGGGDTYIRDVYAPLESRFWHCVCLTGQQFVFAVLGALLHQPGDDGFTWSERNVTVVKKRKELFTLAAVSLGLD